MAVRYTDEEIAADVMAWVKIDDYVALQKIDLDRLDALLSAGSNTFAHEAAANGAVRCLEIMINEVPHLLNKIDSLDWQWTPLHYAANKGHLGVVEFLVRNGADIYAKSSLDANNENMPIHIAASKGQLAVVKFLIRKFPDLITAANGFGDYPIHVAAQNNQFEVVDFFSAIGVDIDIPEEAGISMTLTCLHHAAMNGSLDLVKFLVYKGASVKAKSSPDVGGDTPVHLAALVGQLPIVEFFIEGYPELKTLKNADGCYPIHRAAFAHQTQVIEYFLGLDEGGLQIDVEDESKMKQTCLHIAAFRGSMELVKWLVDKGANARAKTGDRGELPIHLAASSGQLAAVQFFVENYGDLKTAKNIDGELPIHSAASGNHLGVVEYFVKLGIDVDVPDDVTKRTCLHKAAATGHLDLVKWLVSNGADVLAKSGDNDGQNTPLHLAASFGHLPTVQFLIENYPDLKTTPNNSCDYSIHCAAGNNQIEVVKYFVSITGVDVNLRAVDKLSHQQTCLHKAARFGHLDLAKWLVDNGADVCAKDDVEDTPLHLAAFYGHLSIVQFLIDKYPELLDVKNNCGQTSLEKAKQQDRAVAGEVVDWLQFANK